jgi:nicotinate-nucleotide adenylyltransferase
VNPPPQFSTPDASDASPLALFGGTFDPVHWGHLRVARDTAAALKLPEVRLIPAQQNVLRDRPGASGADRLAMLQLAVREVPGLVVDDCELRRTSASYTITTLEAFRETYPARPLIWLIGVDAFLRIQSWHRAQALFDFAHFVVLNRPGFATANVFSAALSDIWTGRVAQDASALREALFGRIYLHTVMPQTASSTEIRNKIRNRAADNELQALLPSAVLSYIRAHELYLD